MTDEKILVLALGYRQIKACENTKYAFAHDMVLYMEDALKKELRHGKSKNTEIYELDDLVELCRWQYKKIHSKTSSETREKNKWIYSILEKNFLNFCTESGNKNRGREQDEECS